MGIFKQIRYPYFRCFVIDNKLHTLVLICSLIGLHATSQELEPRAMNNLPVNTNFLIGGYGFAHGNILLDPAIPIEDLNSNLHSLFAAYVRSINFFSLSSKIDVFVPFVAGDWSGELEEDNSEISRNGIGDLRLRLSFNYLGSKAMNLSEFSSYKAESISGFSLQIIAPTGNYNSDQLINIGSNRWAFKSQWGFSKNLNKWIIESYIGFWLFTNNNNFLNGNKLAQNPLYTFKVHVIKELPKNIWLAFNIGYGIGGKTEVNGIPRDTEISTARLGVIYAMPIAKKHTLKFAYISGFRFKRGSDFDAVSVSYQYRWNNKVNKRK